MNKVNIDKNITIADNQPVFIIADIGSNHKQDLNFAKESIDAAIDAGANAVKFQSIKLDELYHKPDKKTAEFIKKLEFPEKWHNELKNYCDKKDIIFFSSPTYLKAIDLLEQINVKLYKLASAQVGTFPLLVEEVAKLKKPTIFSTGIASYEEVTKTVSIFKKHNNNKFIILHCNSIYPTPPEKVNLSLINTYKLMFNNPVGFSDHTIGTHIACAAVVMGANVIEKHFTLSRKLNTPDSTDFALEPNEFKAMVKQIRDIEAAKQIFDNRIEINNQELKFKQSITTKLIIKHNIPKEHILKKTDFSFLRNKKGIDVKEIGNIIGKKINKSLKKGDILEYKHITS